MLYLQSVRITYRFRFFASTCKMSFSLEDIKKCGCKDDRQPNLKVPYSTMVQNFKVLATPVKSASDKKEYKVIQLENGLVACLISDPSASDETEENEVLSENETTDDEMSSEEDSSEDSSDDEDELPIEQKMAAAGLCVGVGSFSDPKEVPGMAHFLEHMVFMGSEKFPAENDFDSFIKKGGGSNNAATDTETTCFYFECLEKYLQTALDKMAQFFIKPLMSQNAIAREREAIESEFQMALPSDVSKKEQLLCSFAHPETPVNTFSWGNLITLRDNISDEKLYEGVHKFRQRHYSAHRMTLAVQARLPLDTLQEYVLECFSNVPNNNLPPEDFSPHIPTVFDTKEFKMMYYVKPTKDISHLDLTWHLPPLLDKYKTNPMRYLSHLIGDEGSGSLTSYLRKKLWAVGVTAGNEEGGMEFNSIYSLFSINIVLTDDGLKHVEEIIEAVYSYINMLKRFGPQERIFNELKLISDTSFQYATEEPAVDTVEELCESMQFYPPNDYITGSDLFYEYNEEILRTVTNTLNPERMNVMIWTRNLPDSLTFNKKEQWFGTEYTDLEISSSSIEKWKNAPEHPELQLPPPNQYVSKEFSIISESANHPEYPQKIVGDPLLEIWYRKDQKFKLPLSYFRFYLISTTIQESAENAAMLDLMLNLFLFSFAEELYPAMCAGLTPNFITQEKGLVIKLSGYSDKIPVLVENIAIYLSQLNDRISEEIFSVIKDKLRKGYQNKLLKPSKLAKDIRLYVLLDKFFTPIEKCEALQNIDLPKIKTFISQYLSSLYIKCLVQGNISEEDAKKTVNKFAEHLKCTPLAEVQPSFRVIQVPIGQKNLCIQGLNKEDANSVVVNYYQGSPFTMKDSVIIDIILQIIEEPLFDILRTKEQLGYHVDCSARNTFGVLGYMIKVECQATKFTTAHVDQRIEEFLVHTKKLLQETTKEQLEQIKDDLIKTKEVADVHLQEEVGRNWEEIATDDYMFDRNQLEIEEIRTISLKEIQDWWSQHNRFGTKENFRKISIQIVGHTKHLEENSENESTEEIKLVFCGNGKNDNLDVITDIPEFKQNVFLYPVLTKK